MSIRCSLELQNDSICLRASYFIFIGFNVRCILMEKIATFILCKRKKQHTPEKLLEKRFLKISSCFATLLKLQFGMDVLLLLWCIFSEQLCNAASEKKNKWLDPKPLK